MLCDYEDKENRYRLSIAYTKKYCRKTCSSKFERGLATVFPVSWQLYEAGLLYFKSFSRVPSSSLCQIVPQQNWSGPLLSGMWKGDERGVRVHPLHPHPGLSRNEYLKPFQKRPISETLLFQFYWLWVIHECKNTSQRFQLLDFARNFIIWFKGCYAEVCFANIENYHSINFFLPFYWPCIAHRVILPANNCLQRSVLLQIIFCVLETTLLCEKRQIGSCQSDLMSARHWQIMIFCSTSLNNCKLYVVNTTRNFIFLFYSGCG